MDIKSKWGIGSLLQFKFFSPEQSNIVVYEVQFIHTETCSAGTQVFYTVRPIIITYQPNFSKIKEEAKKLRSVEHGVTKDGTVGTLPKFREDELVDCKDEFLNLLQTKQS